MTKNITASVEFLLEYSTSSSNHIDIDIEAGQRTPTDLVDWFPTESSLHELLQDECNVVIQ